MTEKDKEDEKPVANGNNPLSPVEEGTEVEPCMGKPSRKKGHKSRLSGWLVTNRDRVCRKTGLTPKGANVALILGIVFLLLLVAVVAMAASWPRTQHKHNFPVCNRPECLRVAAQIQESLNASHSPCTNVWDWACGGWLQKYSIPDDKSRWNAKELLLYEESRRIRDLIVTLKLPLHTGSVDWMLKNLYDTCMDVDSIKVDGSRPLTDIITELGGWYILRDFNLDDFEQRKILKILHEKYSVTPFFRVSVEANPRIPGKSSIRISPSGLGLPDKEYYYNEYNEKIQTAYKELIRDVVIYLGSTRNEAGKFGNDMYFYEKRIAEVTPNTSNLQNPIKTYNSVSLSELIETTPSIPFLDLLSALYPDSNITESTDVIVTSLEYLTQISQIISTTDRHTMNGYLIWSLVRNYLPYLSDNFTHALYTFHKELFDFRKQTQRWETCSRIVQDIMGLATNYIDAKNNPTNQKTSDIIHKMFEKIRQVTLKQIYPLKKNTQLYRQLSQKINGLKLQLGLPKDILEESYIKSYYQKFKVIKSHLLISVRNGLLLKRNREEQRLLRPTLSDNILEYNMKNIPETIYLPSDNVVYVPAILTKNPLFDQHYPKSILFGRLGVEIANAFVSAIYPYGSFWTADMKLLSEFHATINNSVSSINSAINCLNKKISNLEIDVPDNVRKESSLKILKYLTAVNIANTALLEALINEDHIHQPTLEDFEDSALFFLTNAQTHCGKSTERRQFFDLITNLDLNEDRMLKIIWNQVVQFPYALGCTADKTNICSFGQN